MIHSDISSAIVSSGGLIQLSVNSRRLEQLILYNSPLCSSHLHLSSRIRTVKCNRGCSSIIQQKRKSGRSIIRISKLLFQLDMEKSTLIPLSTVLHAKYELIEQLISSESRYTCGLESVVAHWERPSHQPRPRLGPRIWSKRYATRRYWRKVLISRYPPHSPPSVLYAYIEPYHSILLSCFAP